MPKKFAKISVLILLLAAVPASTFLVSQNKLSDLSSHASGEAVATLDDYWNGKAEWKLVHKYTMDNAKWNPEDNFQAGTNVEVVNGVWYWFSRRIYRPSDPERPVGCTITPLGTYVRKSIDQGATWSDPVTILPLRQGSAWQCAATDGDAFYDSSQNRWHYVFQCMGTQVQWNGCHAIRDGADPMGEFTDPGGNPVIQGGAARDLWRDICNNGSKECFQIGGDRVGDAGTFHFIEKRDGYYYLNFHGYAPPYGFVGIAKTADFIHWIAGDPSQGVPADAIFNKNDQTNWREQWVQNGAIGGGAASILKENNYYFALIEGPDVDLGSADNQNWDIGLLRSNDLTRTHWDQYPQGNPIIYSAKVPNSQGAFTVGSGTPAYVRFIKDDVTGKISLMYGIWVNKAHSDEPDYENIAEYFYELVPTANILQNANLWKCNSENWSTFPGQSQVTNMVTYRRLDRAFEGTCYLAFNCGGASCQNNQSIYQDTYVPQGYLQDVSWGGQFATGQGTGYITLTLFEFNSQGEMIKYTDTNVTIGEQYQLAEGHTRLDPQTTKVRYQIYLNSPNTFRADSMFIKSADLKLGDVNQDGEVDAVDLGMVIQSYYTNPIRYQYADLNGDNVVDAIDLNLVIQNYYK